MKIIQILFAIVLSVPMLAHASFADVPAKHTYQPSIEILNRAGILEGYPDGLFRPEQTINRAEATKILVHVFFPDVELACNNNIAFHDVKTTDWFAPYVCIAVEKGIVSGYPGRTFQPGNTIIFAEFAKIVAEAMKNLDSEIEFQKGVQWYEQYFDYLSNKKAIPLSLLAPDATVNRGEASEILARLMYDHSGPSIQYDLAQQTFKACNYRFYPERTQYKFAAIQVADKQSFEVLQNPHSYCEYYAKDRHYGYYEYINIVGSDPASFEVVGNTYAKDKHRAYYKEQYIDNVDLDTFEGMGIYLARDKNHVYKGTEVVRGSNGSALQITNSTNQEVAEDGVYVYINGEVQTGGAPGTFEKLNDSYAKDANNVYFRGEAISGVDAPSFQVLNEMFGKDKDNLIYLKQVIQNIDVDSVTVDSLYVFDKHHVYIMSYGDAQRVEGADPASFSVFPLNPNLGKDNANIFNRGHLVPEFDVDTFEALRCAYAKDKNGVYNMSVGKLSGIDPDSVEVLWKPGEWGLVDCTGLKDKNGTYDEFDLMELIDLQY